jgi:hypothetical protein
VGWGHQQVSAIGLTINSKVVVQLPLNFTISMLKSQIFHEIFKPFSYLIDIWQEISMSIRIQDLLGIGFKIWQLGLNR